MTQPTIEPDIIAAILQEGCMSQFQDPKVQKRTDVKRPFYFIKPYVPIVAVDGKVTRKQKPLRLGWCDEITTSAAKKEKQRLMAAINQDNGRPIAMAQAPFKALCDRFLTARVPQLGAATQAKYRNHLKNHVMADLGELRLAEIDQPILETWLNAKQAAGLSWWTRCDLRNLVSAIFSKAQEWRIWPGDNPCARITVTGRGEAREKRLLPAGDLQRLLAALRKCEVVVEGVTGKDVALMIMIALAAGVRISEVLGLQWRDIDLEHETLKVERRWWRGDIAPPKSKASRRLRQIASLAHDLLKPKYAKPEDWVFMGVDGNPPDDRNLDQHILRPVAVALGIYWKGFGFHTFRRQNITWRQEVGAHVYEAQKSAGHARPSTTWDYTLVDERRERDQVERILGRVRNAKQKVVKIG